MGAECFVCGHDLPYDGGCSYCELKARAESAEARCESYREALEEAGRVANELGYGTADCAEDERPFTAREIRALERPLTKAVRAALAVPQEGKE